MGKFFGTDGVRGIANKNLSANLSFMLGFAGASVLTNKLSHKPKILVAKDTRLSGDMLECALCAGICQTGAEVVSLGVLPTPAVSYLIKKYGADAGVVISASHNSFEYNGIKFFDSQSHKLSDELEEKIEDFILNYKKDDITLPTHDGVGHIEKASGGADDYIKYLSDIIDCSFENMNILLDCANGSNSYVAPKALNMLGANVDCINCAPDGININDNCGSTHIKTLEEKIRNEKKYDIGISFDGDADRMLAVDENGVSLTGDEIMLIIANYLKQKGALSKNTIVATKMSNLGFFIAAEKLGINVVKTDVGDRYVLEQMLKGSYSLGGEESGHIICLDYNSTGDGLLSALLVLKIMKTTSTPLSELRKIVTILPQVLINANVKSADREKILKNEKLLCEIDEVEEKLGRNGRVLIRPSGTEPVVRVMLEGSDKDFIYTQAKKLASLIESLSI